MRNDSRADLRGRQGLAAEIVIAEDGEERDADAAERADAVPLRIGRRRRAAGIERVAGDDDGVERRARVQFRDAVRDAIRSFAGVADDRDAQRGARAARAARAEAARRG